MNEETIKGKVSRVKEKEKEQIKERLAICQKKLEKLKM